MFDFSQFCSGMTFLFSQRVLSRYRHAVQVVLVLAFTALAPLARASTQTTETTLAVTSAGAAVTTVASHSTITLTATVTAAGAPVLLGQVKFCDAAATYCTDIHIIGSAQMTSAGTASVSIVPALGQHSYRAVFDGITRYGTSLSTASTLNVIGKYPTTTSIVSSGVPGNYSLTATVSGSGTSATSPSGVVSFLAASSAPLVGTAGLVAGSSGFGFLEDPTSVSVSGVTRITVGDFNRDGRQDFLVCGTDGRVTVGLGNGDGTFQVTPPQQLLQYSSPTAVAVGDFNLDGKVDLAVTQATSLTVLLGNGDGTFSKWFGTETGAIAVGIAVGDWNEDGILDLAVANDSSASPTIYLGNGDATFTAAASPVTDSGSRGVLTADFNGDGIADLAVEREDADGTMGIYLGNGDGTFTALSPAPSFGTYISFIVIGDFNQDGKADIAATSAASSSVSIFLGNGDGTFTQAATSPTTSGIGPGSIVIGDFNGDHIPDLVVEAGNSDPRAGATVLLGNGDGTFQTAGSFAAGTASYYMASADFNGDGDTDLILVDDYAFIANVQYAVNPVYGFLAQPTRNATATASSISPVGTGDDLVMASYAGDPSFESGTSPAIGITAERLPTTLTVFATPTTTTFGRQVTLTAMLTPYTAQGLSSDFDSITFLSGGSPISSTTLLSGVATLNITSLDQGTNNITASFDGDYNFLASSSNTFTETILPYYGLRFVPISPCRAIDTRGSAGAFGAPELAGGSTREFDLPQSSCGIPSTAVAYSLNVTVLPDQTLQYLTLWPSHQAQPNVSTLNSYDGRVKANAAITPAGSNGGVSVFVSDASNLIIDVNGYFVPASDTSALAFYPVTPCRVADTRGALGELGGPFLTAKTSRSFPVQSGTCGIPANAQAYSLNVTTLPHAKLNYLTAWPTGQPQPNVSTLNAPTGAVTANAAIIPAGTSGAVSLFASDDADLILDVNGYFAPARTNGLSLYTTEPCRVLDTRSLAGQINGVLPVQVGSSPCPQANGAQAYVINATVVPSGPLVYLTLWPDSESQPNVSTLNADDAAITSNMAIVPTSNGTIDVFSSNPTQVIVDITSYFAP